MIAALLDAKRRLNETTIGHDKFLRALNQAWTHVNALRGNAAPAEQRKLLILVGPTGSGKTRLLNILQRRLIPTGIETPNGDIPYLYALATTTKMNGMSYRDMYIQALQFMNEPMLDRKVITSIDEMPELRQARRIYGRGTEAAYQDALIRAVRYRRTHLFCLDDAQELLRTKCMLKLSDPLVTLRGLADKMPCCIMLSGVLEVLKMWASSAHVIRRSRVIELERYRDNDTDRRGFLALLKNLDEKIPLKRGSYCDQAEWFWSISYGCAGKVFDMVNDGLNVAIEEGAKCLTWGHLREIKRFEIEVCEHRSEIDRGEALLKEFGAVGARRDVSIAKTSRLPGRRNPRRDSAFGFGGDGI